MAVRRDPGRREPGWPGGGPAGRRAGGLAGHRLAGRQEPPEVTWPEPELDDGAEDDFFSPLELEDEPELLVPGDDFAEPVLVELLDLLEPEPDEELAPDVLRWLCAAAVAVAAGRA